MLKLQFTKMHGLGNDYVYVNCLAQKLRHASEVARLVSDRHFGIGSDGLVLICPSDKADFEMRIYNADGSEANMCGNALRCVGKYVYDRKLIDKTRVEIDTKSGVKKLKLTVENDVVTEVEAEMGVASLRAKDIPVDTDDEDFISRPMLVRGEVYLVTGVSMGNAHAVIFCEDVDSIDLAEIGPLFENHEKFPDRINTEFIELIDHRTLKMRVWERGSGETLACGTGACAAVVAAVINEHCAPETEITVRLRGGELKITCHDDYGVTMKGGATQVFDGEIELALS